MQIKKTFYYLRIIISSIYFNFKYLPLSKAVKLPILLYKPKLISTKGKILIDSEKIYFGMVRLGLFRVSIYPNNGITWEDNGGITIFRGSCYIGNNSAISIGYNGQLIFGDNFCANASLKLVSYHKIEFHENVLIGWDTLFMDTNFHTLTNIETGEQKKANGAICIGANNWFAARCTVLHSVKTPDFVTFSTNTILTKNTKYESYSIVAGSPPCIKAKGFYWNSKTEILSQINNKD